MAAQSKVVSKPSRSTFRTRQRRDPSVKLSSNPNTKRVRDNDKFLSPYEYGKRRLRANYRTRKYKAYTVL